MVLVKFHIDEKIYSNKIINDGIDLNTQEKYNKLINKYKTPPETTTTPETTTQETPPETTTPSETTTQETPPETTTPSPETTTPSLEQLQH